MCGIYARFGSFNINEALTCLKRLEYRGYDSYGISYNNNIIYKKIGRIKLVKDNDNYLINKCISHTRWATNGSVTINNAHPQASFDNNVVLVHNGILENELEIKETYLKNISLKSQTDSEVIANLINYFLKSNSPLESILKVKEIIKGQYAIAFMIKDDDNIYFMKKKMSLLLAYDNNNYYLSSDIVGLNNTTLFYKHLADDSYGYIGNNLYTNDTRPFLEYNFHHEKEELSSLMLKEIYEEESAAINLLNTKDNINENIISLIDKYNDIVILGCGSSFYAGEYIAYLLEEELSKRCKVILPSEFKYKTIYRNSLFILISQSGETADLINILESINIKNTILFTNNINSSLSLSIPYIVDIKAGPEYGVASTKSFNQTILSFYLIMMAIKEEEPLEIKSYLNNIDEIKKSFNNKIPKQLSLMNNVFYLGTGLDYIISKEAALKLKELAYIPCEGYSYKELKHGSLALISDKSTVIGLSSSNTNIIPTLNEVKSRNGNIIYLTIKYPSKCLGSLSLARYIQLIAYYTSKELGNDPDHPRNLAKSVTVI